MKPTVYLETSIIGYLASRPSRDLVTAANQQITHEWWDKHRENYDLFVSQAVVDECGAGGKRGPADEEDGDARTAPPDSAAFGGEAAEERRPTPARHRCAGENAE